MGALTENRKRLNDIFSLSCAFPPLHTNSGSPDVVRSKKPRITLIPVSETPFLEESAKSFVSKLRRLPPPAPLPRIVHGPQRNRKLFGSVGSVRKPPLAAGMGIFQSSMNGQIGTEETIMKASPSIRKSENAITGSGNDSARSRDVMEEYLSVEEYKRLVEQQEGHSLASGWITGDEHLLEQKVLNSPLEPSMSAVSVSTALTQNGDEQRTMMDFVSIDHVVERPPSYKELYESSKRRDSKLRSLDFQLKLTLEKRFSAFELKDQVVEEKEDLVLEPFVPLTDEDEGCVAEALSGSNKRELLVTHESSNIEITRGVLQCLKPGAWLNDEVINLYLELLKEREVRHPKKFLKCHFFSTFFYKKLISGRSGYDYKAVRRWTTQKKIGYGLIECDKIFVPIHREIHWCLAVINIKDEKFQYLDSLGGLDSQVLKVLARYFVDEVKDKSNKVIDISSWKQELVDDLPEQKNGWDCGMFMIKYADFYSRGLTLCFSQVYVFSILLNYVFYGHNNEHSALKEDGSSTVCPSL